MKASRLRRSRYPAAFLALFCAPWAVDGQAAAAAQATIRAVAQNPAAHLGRLSVDGVVGIVTPQKGFVLVDMDEYRAEGFTCLTTAEKTKIPIVWPGHEPEVKQVVHVEGELAKTAAGYVFTATEVTP